MHTDLHLFLKNCLYETNNLIKISNCMPFNCTVLLSDKCSEVSQFPATQCTQWKNLSSAHPANPEYLYLILLRSERKMPTQFLAFPFCIFFPFCIIDWI